MINWPNQWCQNRGFAPTDPTTTPRPSVPPPSACTAPRKHTRPYIRVPYALPGRRSPARIRFPDIEALASQAKSYEFKSPRGYFTFFLYLFSNFSSYILRRLKTWKLLIYKIFWMLDLLLKMRSPTGLYSTTTSCTELFGEKSNVYFWSLFAYFKSIYIP